MAEMKRLSEPASPWPAVTIGAVGLGAVAALLWGGGEGPLAQAGTGSWARFVPLVGLELAVTAAAVATLLAAPRRLAYRVRGDRLTVRTLVGGLRVELSEVTGAEVLSYRLPLARSVHLGWPRSHVPGYYVGTFRLEGLGRTRVAVGARSGDGVLLHRADGGRLLLAPRDPAELLALVERYRSAERPRSASSRRGRRRR